VGHGSRATRRRGAHLSDTLTLRDLNRATLARQLLLEQAAYGAAEGLERLVGAQAQAASAPFIGLWAPLRDFRRDDLLTLIAERRVVRATLMRATLHLFTAADYVRLRPALQPALTQVMRATLRRRADGLDVDRVVAAARAFFAAPHSFNDIMPVLAEVDPKHDARALIYAARTGLPLVQVPSDGPWGYGAAGSYIDAGVWLRDMADGETAGDATGAAFGAPKPADGPELVRRYLAAFGPATLADVHAWLGAAVARDAVEELRPALVAFRDGRGRELLDLPDAPRPPTDTPAPPRFLPEFDNLVLGHADRSRVITKEYSSRIFVPAVRVLATVLVDGFVVGTWKIDKTHGHAAVVVAPFEPIARRERADLETEGERLLRFVEPDAYADGVRFLH
jgi:hypothetical protein